MLNYLLSKKNVIIILALLSVRLFTPIYIPNSILAILNFVGSMIIVLMFIIYLVYKDPGYQTIKPNFSTELILLFLGIFLSVPMAYIFHGQNPLITIFAQAFTYYLLVYFILHNMAIDRKFLEQLIFTLAITWCLIFLLQYFLYPQIILNSRVHTDRGTIRIFFPGYYFGLIAYFYALHRVLTVKVSGIHVVYLLVFFVISAILQATRSHLGSILLLSGLFVMFYRGVKMRLIIVIFGIIAAAGMVLIFSDIFLAMLNVSEQQIGETQYSESIREQSLRFFMTEFMPHPSAYIFGNGADHGSSGYGMRILHYKQYFGFYQSDIGMLGEYSKFGILYLIGILAILFRGMFMKLPDSVNYLRYVFGFVFLINILGAGVFADSAAIFAIMTMLYMIDFEKDKQKKAPEKQEP